MDSSSFLFLCESVLSLVSIFYLSMLDEGFIIN